MVNKSKQFISVFCVGGLLLVSNAVNAIKLADYPKLQAIADELIAEQMYSQPELDALFARATIQQSVLGAMTSPAEYTFTWGKYRKLFLQPDRIQKGVEFWQQYRAELTRAEQQYGVPASVIVAIIGVESKFGQYRGKHKVLDSLVTLVTGYPRRSRFFASELKHFLILAKQNQLMADQILGSYAGAVGYPQFISSSYRNYAVDFSGDGKTDLINQPIDAIGSVANYFVKNGWLTGQPVTSKPVNEVNATLHEMANRKRKVKYPASELRTLGAQLAPSIADTEKLNVLRLNASEIVPDKALNNAYIVRAGDTACEIAERFSVPCKVLFELNKLNQKGAIFRGQKLKLPTKNNDGDTNDNRESGNWVIKNTTDQEQPRYFFTHENFYVITRYNHSVLYAMAVHDLSNEIAQAYSSQSQNDTIFDASNASQQSSEEKGNAQ